MSTISRFCCVKVIISEKNLGTRFASDENVHSCRFNYAIFSFFCRCISTMLAEVRSSTPKYMDQGSIYGDDSTYLAKGSSWVGGLLGCCHWLCLETIFTWARASGGLYLGPQLGPTLDWPVPLRVGTRPLSTWARPLVLPSSVLRSVLRCVPRSLPRVRPEVPP